MPKSILLLIFFSTFAIGFGQTAQQKNLEEQKIKLQKEIKENEKKLQTVKKQEKNVISAVNLQNDKIKLKENLIKTTEKQANLLSNDIYANQVEINKLEGKLSLLKAEYAQMILKSYKSRSEESRAMFLLSSDNFYQAYKRAQYMKQLSTFRRMQGQEIQQKSNELQKHNEKLGALKHEKEVLISENDKERLSLEKEKSEQQKLLAQLQKDKAKIIKEIRKKESAAKAIDKKIEKIIRDAIAEANRKAAAERAAKLKAEREKAAKEKLERERAAREKAEKERMAREKGAKEAEAYAKAKASAPVESTESEIKKEVAKMEKEDEKNTSSSSNKIILTKEGKIESNNFKANKGRLPWPVEKGYISMGYGNQAHPIYKTLVVHNSGLEISTEKGASARAVFEGEVTSVLILSPVNRAVVVQHGDFFTVYQNLSSVNVGKGDKVNIKQSLGKIRTNGEGKTILKFTLSQNATYVNPKEWISAG